MKHVAYQMAYGMVNQLIFHDNYKNFYILEIDLRIFRYKTSCNRVISFSMCIKFYNIKNW